MVAEVRRGLAAAVALFVMGGCGSDDAESDVVRPVRATPAPGTQEVEAEARAVELEREVFTFRGAARDPFVSLVRSGETRPEVRDLRIMGINFDARYPTRSVAVLRDTTDGRRYNVRAGDALGRMRVTEVRPTEVVLLIEEFGLERQMVLSVRRRGLEVNP